MAILVQELSKQKLNTMSPVLNMSYNGSCTEGARREMSCWTVPPHGTLTSALPTLAPCPVLPKESHSKSLGFALPPVPCLVFLAYPGFACLAYVSLALPYPGLPGLAKPCLPLPALPSMQARHCKPSAGNCGRVRVQWARSER